jgi:hypothetical protein
MAKEMNLGAGECSGSARVPMHQRGAAVHPLKGVLPHCTFN